MIRPSRPITRGECERLLEACTQTRAAPRNRALLILLYRAGLRSGEAIGLDVENVWRVPGGMVVRVAKPKGYQRAKAPTPPREMGLDPKATAIVSAYLEQRGDGSGPLLLSKSGRRLTTSYVRQLLPRLARLAGIEQRVHPHALRHLAARELYDELGYDLRRTQLALGHARLETTATYLRSIGMSEVTSWMVGREW